jgi:uncharacterized protein (TIGR02145 family)
LFSDEKAWDTVTGLVSDRQAALRRSKQGNPEQKLNSASGTVLLLYYSYWTAVESVKIQSRSILPEGKEVLMKIGIALFMALASVALFHAQAISISGVVKNGSGSGIEGVAVKLGKAGIKTVTGSDGSFTLKDNTGVKDLPHRATVIGDCPFTMKDNRLLFEAAGQTEVTVTAFDCNGRVLFSRSNVSLPGSNSSLPLPCFGRGMHIYRVLVNNEPFVFRSVTGIAAHRGPAASWGEGGLTKQVKAAAPMDDALLFIKEGYTLYRMVMTKPDTSGLQITMARLDTGTVTDADGNVYRTVKIGNQEWTAENLRTTKYNDNTSIGSGHSFYNNITDPAAKKKWGALYTWSAVKGGKLAPKGWHVPSNADWDTLSNYLIAHGYNYDGTTTEDKIAKSMAATTDWMACSEPGAISYEMGLNNASGFSAVPAGWRYWSGNEYLNQKERAYWWTSTPYEADATYSYVRDLWYINFNLDKARYVYIECSVRIVRDK